MHSSYPCCVHWATSCSRSCKTVVSKRTISWSQRRLTRWWWWRRRSFKTNNKEFVHVSCVWITLQKVWSYLKVAWQRIVMMTTDSSLTTIIIIIIIACRIANNSLWLFVKRTTAGEEDIFGSIVSIWFIHSSSFLCSRTILVVGNQTIGCFSVTHLLVEHFIRFTSRLRLPMICVTLDTYLITTPTDWHTHSIQRYN